MNIAIVGGGVMGRLWTGWLTAASQRVTIVDASPIVVRELNDRGIWIDERDGSALHFPASATTRATELEFRADCVLLRQDGTNR